MKGTIDVSTILPSSIGASVAGPLEIEAISSPPRGELKVQYVKANDSLVMKMASEDLSTLRAMLNSYLGLLSAAVKAAE